MKIPSRNSLKQVLGVMVDGPDLRIAHLGWEKGELTVHALESVTLPNRLGKLTKPTGAEAAMLDDGSGDIFGLDDFDDEPLEAPKATYDEDDDIETAPADVSSILMSTFSKYPLKKNQIAVNIPEGQATYYTFESDFGLKGKKLHKRLFDEIAPLSGGTLGSAVIDYFKNNSNELTAVVSEGQIPLMEELIDLKNYLPDMPFFCGVNSNEIALVNLVRAAIDPTEEKVSAVVYIGADFSRVIIMKGRDPISFIQAIREGYTSPQVCQTLFSKILLEQEEAGIPEIEQIILAGEIGVTRAMEFFQRQFPEAEVKPITPGPLDTSSLKNEELAVFANFAIPVALAWERLEPNNESFINVKLVPRSIKDAQKTFKVAWHGFALLAAIFSAMVVLSYQGFDLSLKIRNLNSSIESKQSTIASLQPELTEIGKLQDQINVHKSNLEFLKNIVQDPYKWSRLFEKLSEDFKKVNRIWIDQIISTRKGFTMVGKAVTRDRVPVLAAGLDGVSLHSVNRVVSEEGNTVYEFTLDASIPPPPAEEAIEDNIPSEQTSAMKGKIDAPGKASKTPAKTEQVAPAKAAKPTGNKVEPTKSQPPVHPKGIAPPKKSPEPDEKSVQPPQQTPTVEKVASVDELYDQGIAGIRNHDVEGALKAFNSLIKNYPKDSHVPASYYWLGECHFSDKNYYAAAEAFMNALKYKDNSKRSAGMLMLGMCYEKLNQDDKAIKQYEELIKDYPEGEYTDTAKRKLKMLKHGQED